MEIKGRIIKFGIFFLLRNLINGEKRDAIRNAIASGSKSEESTDSI
jgi:hypothetical protein